MLKMMMMMVGGGGSRPVEVDDGGSKYRLNSFDDSDDNENATLMMKLIYPQICRQSC